jgi:FkbM family methyltransferase
LRERNRAKIAGFDVRYVARWSFDFQREEIFRREQYRFETDAPAPFIVDCGANIGMATLYFKSLYPDATVLAFEPDPAAFACLQENAHQVSDVRVVNAALAPRDGPVDFFYDETDPASLRMSIVRERMPKQSRTVEGVRLSRFLDREVDFLKRDVEAAELVVLRDLADTGRLSLVQQMLIEYHHHIPRTDDALSGLLSLLEDHGFGYQLEARLDRPLPRERTQDVRVYGYLKG